MKDKTSRARLYGWRVLLLLALGALIFGYFGFPPIDTVHAQDGGSTADATPTPVPDTTAPTLSSTSLNYEGEQLTLTFSENMQLHSTLAWLVRTLDVDRFMFFRAVFDVTIDDRQVVPVWGTIRDNTITLIVHSAAQGESVTVSYDNIFAQDAPGLFQDLSGNHLGTFSSQSVTNGSTQEAYEVPGPVMAFSETDLTINEGGSATYTVSLSSAPAHETTVSVEARPSAPATVSPPTLTFTTTNWSTPQTVTVSALEDNDTINYWARMAHIARATDFLRLGVGPRVLIVDND